LFLLFLFSFHWSAATDRFWFGAPNMRHRESERQKERHDEKKIIMWISETIAAKA
jgi:hypothetical protein